jgi:SLT domain-containing protein
VVNDGNGAEAIWIPKGGKQTVWLPEGAQVFTAEQTRQMMANGMIPRYAGGTPGANDILGWIGGGAQGVLNSMLSAFHITPPSLPGSLGNFAGAVLGKVKDWALGWIEQALPSFGGASGGGDFGTAVSGNLRSWIMAGMALQRAPGSWFNALATIAMHESGGNPLAQNNWDINAKNGDPSRGLFQTIGATFRAYALPGHGNIFSGIDNTAAAIGYIRSRYGDVFHVPGIQALAAGKPYIGYANGGVIDEEIVGVGLRTKKRYRFGEGGRKELVSPLGYMPAGTSAIAGGGGSGGVTHVHIHTTAQLDIDGTRWVRQQMPEIVRQIRAI